MNYNKSLFDGVPKKHINKSRFNLSHEYKSQAVLGRLIPVLTLPVYPTDEVEINSEFMFRFQPLYFPIMHKLTMRADYIYIPNRITWIYQSEANKGWTRWLAENPDDVAHPIVTGDMTTQIGYVPFNTLAFMGIPQVVPGTGKSVTITGLNALPLSAYLKIYDEIYRDPNLEPELWFPLQPGDNTTAFVAAYNNAGQGMSGDYFPLLISKWEKDYFTSGLPQPQIGEAIRIPMMGEAPYQPTQMRKVADGSLIVGPQAQIVTLDGDVAAQSGDLAFYDMSENAATVRDLTWREKLQSLYERMMKIGQRYNDFMEGIWGEEPQPGLIDRPVMIGSKFGRVQITDVSTTAYTVTETPEVESKTGDFTGQAHLYSAENDEIRYKVPEHGFIICILQMNPNTSYGQGIARFWRYTTQQDYPVDYLSTVGDQEIKKEEVLYNAWTADAAKNNETFAYIPRHSEARYQNNIHIGNLNNGFGLSQHMGRVWDVETVKGTAYDDYIQINALFVRAGSEYVGGARTLDTFRQLPADGVVIPVEGNAFMHIFHSIYVNRQLPLYATPGA